MTLPHMSKDVYDLNAGKLGEIAETKPASKYGNVRTTAKGLTFQSGHEANEIGKLITLDEKHIIFGLRLQVRFRLNNGESYIADATYLSLDEKCGQLISHVIDCKGFRTRDYLRKRKLFRDIYGQDIEEM